jgi:hypothetical protein
MINDYLSLSTRAGFNKSLGHFRMVNDIVRRLNQHENLADVIDTLEKEKGVEKAQIGPILNAIVIDRMEYRSRSFNLPVDVQSFEDIQGELAQWNRFDIVLAYHHPQLGISLINPKHRAHLDMVREMNRDELIVMYVRASEDADRGAEEDALSSLHGLLIGRPVKGLERFRGGGAKAPPPPPRAQPAPPAAAAPAAPPPSGAATPVAAVMPPPPAPTSPAPAAGGEGGSAPPPPSPSPGKGGKVRMTPKYSVQVSNELFHNGNVEAWKNIVESYKTKFPGLDVHIFHDGQKVNNINALFKWGKVKHGDVILFCVSGEEIKGVAKLQRYLYEGASIRFENYLKKDVNKVLNLF